MSGSPLFNKIKDMTNLIDLNYFQGLLHLPYANLQSASTASSGKAIDIQQQQLERQISIHQKDYLTRMFGSEVVPTEVEDLLIDDVLFVSPIANYVFCQILPYYASRATASGEKKKGASSSTDMDYQGRQLLAWNQMVYMNGLIREKLEELGKENEYPTDYNSAIYVLQSEIW